MALPASDVFTGTNNTALTTYSASWSVSSAGFVIYNNACSLSGGSGHRTAYWNADSFGNDQYSKIIRLNTPFATWYCVNPAVRCASGINGYVAYFTSDSGTLTVKYVDGAETQLGSSGSGTASSGDTCSIEANGTTITVKLNNSTTGMPTAQTDTSFDSGAAGLHGYGGQVDWGSANSWEGGNLGVSTPAVSVSESAATSDTPTVAPLALPLASLSESSTATDSVTVQIEGVGPPTLLINVAESAVIDETPIVGRYHTFGNSARIPAAANTAATTDPLTDTFTCDAGSTVMALMLVYATGGTRTGGAPTYNGLTLTQADTVRRGTTSPECSCEMWYLLDPPTGQALTISIQNDGALNMFAMVATAKAGEGSTSMLDVATGVTAASSTNPTLNVTTLVNGDVIFAVVANGANAWAPSGQTGTVIFNGDPATWGGGSQYKLQTVAGVQAMGWTFGTSEDWGEIIASFKLTPAPSVSESSVITDTPTVLIQEAPPAVDVSESSSASDTPVIAPLALAPVSATESSVITDTLTVAIASLPAQTIDVSESSSIADAVTVQGGALVLSVSESATAADAVAAALAAVLQISAAETSAIAETVVVTYPPFMISVADSAVIAEQISAAMALALSIATAESAVIADEVSVALVAVGTLSISVTEAATIADSPAAVTGNPGISVAEASTLSEQISAVMALVLVVSKAEAATTADAVQARVQTAVISAAEASVISDSVTVTPLALALVRAESAAITDQPTVLIQIAGVFQISVQDGASISETVAALLSSLLTPLISVAESATASDSAAVVLPGAERISVSETAVTTDAPAAVIPVRALVADQSAISDSVQVRLALTVQVSESVNTVDAATIGAMTLVVVVMQGIVMDESVNIRLASNMALEALFKGMYRGTARRMRT